MGALLNPFLGGIRSTWNPLDKGANINLTNSNLDAANATAAWAAVRDTTSLSAGKKYFEVLVAAADGTAARLMVGFGKNDFTLSNFVGATSTSASFQDATGLNVSGMTNTGGSSAPSFNTTNKIVGVCIDLAGSAWFSVDNVWIKGDPSAGTSPSITFTGGVAIFPACAIFGGSTGKLRLITNAAALTYAPPTGASAWDS